MQEGEYHIARSATAFQVMDQLIAGSTDLRWLVIPEGKTLAQVRDLVAELELTSAEAFEQAASVSPQQAGLPVQCTRDTLEGYLMPDSYRVPAESKAPELVRLLTRTWRTRIWEPNRSLFEKSDLSPDEVVILASLIEREARVDADRARIASVIRNRLMRKMRLQIDATVLFALGEHKERVTFADLKVDSPYNTYAHAGLPPGPICSPGLKSVRAALQPADTDFLYYVAQADGSHVFTRTLAEHEAAVAEARRAAKAARRGPHPGLRLPATGLGVH
jgi:UPF0755 protein